MAAQQTANSNSHFIVEEDDFILWLAMDNSIQVLHQWHEDNNISEQIWRLTVDSKSKFTFFQYDDIMLWLVMDDFHGKCNFNGTGV